MRSSAPLTPLGILVKSPCPSFCFRLKVQLPLPVTCKSSLRKKKKISSICFFCNYVMMFLLCQRFHQLPGILCGLANRRTCDIICTLRFGHIVHTTPYGAGQCLAEHAVPLASGRANEFCRGFTCYTRDIQRSLYL